MLHKQICNEALTKNQIENRTFFTLFYGYQKYTFVDFLTRYVGSSQLCSLLNVE